jgi:tetrahydromethanopterin S-methyltransferase subunit G
MGKNSERLERQLDKVERRVPNMAARVLQRLRRPGAQWVRIPLGILLVFGGIFSFLPVLGIWMLPLGLILLALDLVFLQGPVNLALVRGTRKWSTWNRTRRDRKAQAQAAKDQKDQS